jgi:hypothetical protein
MRNALALTIATALGATAMPWSEPAQAYERWPAIPAELGRAPVGRDEWAGIRCSDAPVNNFYDGALYREPPAVYLGYAYRPFYRYTAYRTNPRTYFCPRGEYR